MSADTENGILLSTIINDDIEAFDKIIDQKKGKLSICYGRFPLLSICYLYKSKKIIKKYEQQLSKIKNYTFADEEYCIYETFKKRARKTLRFYVYENRLVTPPEMLAIIGELKYLESVYKSLFENEETTNNLSKICKLQYNKDLKNEEYGIFFPKQPLSTKQKNIFKLALTLTLIFIIIFATIGFSFISIIGIGTINYPIKITNQKQLVLALNSKQSRNYILKNDIIIDNSIAESFSGSLNGNGHTITINSKNALINNLKGNIENVNFVLKDIDRTITDNGGLVINNSSGNISNVKIEINGILFEDNDKNELIFSGLIGTNSGKVDNCKVLIDLSYNGNGVGDASFSGLVGTNEGEINNCSILQNSKIITDTIDVAGIVVHNEKSGKIYECENNGIIEQNSSIKEWNPNTSGIAVANIGAVKNCINNGKIISTTSANSNLISVFSSGIVCNNVGTVEKCKNTGEIVATSENSFIYAGGVVAYNNQQTAYLENDCNFSKITVNAKNENNIIIFAGGIAAYTESAVKNCFANTIFQNNSTQNWTFLGGIIGVEHWSGVGIDIYNNYYLKNDKITFGIAVYHYFDGSWSLGNDTNCNGVDTLDILKSKGVYWE